VCCGEAQRTSADLLQTIEPGDTWTSLPWGLAHVEIPAKLQKLIKLLEFAGRN
jgi:hypothetical protein